VPSHAWTRGHRSFLTYIYKHRLRCLNCRFLFSSQATSTDILNLLHPPNSFQTLTSHPLRPRHTTTHTHDKLRSAPQPWRLATSSSRRATSNSQHCNYPPTHSPRWRHTDLFQHQVQPVQDPKVAGAILGNPPRGPPQVHHPGGRQGPRLRARNHWLHPLQSVSRRPCRRARVLPLQHHVPEDRRLLLEEHAQEPQGRGCKFLLSTVCLHTELLTIVPHSCAGLAPSAARTRRSAAMRAKTATTTAEATAMARTRSGARM
jgi:hypothetical protein